MYYVERILIGIAWTAIMSATQRTGNRCQMHRRIRERGVPKKLSKAEREDQALDRMSVHITSLVADRVTRDGELMAYDCIEAAREIKVLMRNLFRKLRNLK